MEDAKKIIKECSYLFFFLAALDVVFIVFLVVAGNKADLTSVENAKTMLIGSGIAYLIDVAFDVYLGVKGLAEVKGENEGNAHITLALILFVLQVISIPVIIYSLTKGDSTWVSLADAVVSCVVVWLYYSNCKKLKAK